MAISRRVVDIDTDTGQVYKDKTIKFSNFNADKGYLFKAKNQGVKTFADVKLSEQVKNDFDFLRCHKLAEHIYKDTNMISIRHKTDIRAADVEDISNIINLSVKKTREFLSRMRKAHIIAEREDKVGDMISVKYYFNPLFFCSSKYLSPDLYFLFQESLDVYIPGWAKAKFHELGNIKKEKQRSDNMTKDIICINCDNKIDYSKQSSRYFTDDDKPICEKCWNEGE